MQLLQLSETWKEAGLCGHCASFWGFGGRANVTFPPLFVSLSPPTLVPCSSRRQRTRLLKSESRYWDLLAPIGIVLLLTYWPQSHVGVGKMASQNYPGNRFSPDMRRTFFRACLSWVQQ